MVLFIYLFYLYCLPEVCYRDMHGAVFVNIPKEIPQAELTLIQIILCVKEESVWAIYEIQTKLMFQKFMFSIYMSVYLIVVY